ncbi:adenylate isopentenyltransferase 3, chloroplastic-like [Olea europaea var. sylvestris]|uniref:adenylate dimethylallyltransferase (ADP/ATP-dependent) n=1 Tax=Olea europaea subsp. europaea TaxID=158383 RepID=A0A8S0SSS4_OLEEU|nr:adenylate isopentenyltransferase 3, chloroplastic-like [Olea europaea var. sylvestris]CAA2995938.1 adenylate isopentenyltransferase 3, chloroplastic-like [Olea europaea subsp. europaea]
MRMSLSMCKHTPFLSHIPQIGKVHCHQPPKEKVVVVMGATGTGKSRLSIDIATRFPSEIVNSDKMQVYEGLDITTNKITREECCGVPHHLLGVVDPNVDFTAKNFCTMASLAIKSVVNNRRLPIIVGGSNSFIEALIDDKDNKFRSKYECCFLWVDVSMQVLDSFLSNRVDQMVERGMVNEVRNMFRLNADYSGGLRRAIGVPEFDRYFRDESSSNGETRARILEEAINMVKFNTSKLACRQVEKIYRLKDVKGWEVHRIDATDVFRKQGKEANEAWENMVAGPSIAIVSRFLYNFGPMEYRNLRAMRAPLMETAVASATH